MSQYPSTVVIEVRLHQDEALALHYIGAMANGSIEEVIRALLDIAGDSVFMSDSEIDHDWLNGFQEKLRQVRSFECIPDWATACVGLFSPPEGWNLPPRPPLTR